MKLKDWKWIRTVSVRITSYTFTTSSNSFLMRSGCKSPLISLIWIYIFYQVELVLPQCPLRNNNMLLWIQNINILFICMCVPWWSVQTPQMHGSSSGNTHSVVVLISWRTASILNSTRSFTLCSRSSRSSVNQEKEPFHFKYLIIQGTFTNVLCTQQGWKYVDILFVNTNTCFSMAANPSSHVPG